MSKSKNAYSVELTRYTKERADIAELKRKKMEESLVPIDAVEALWGAMVAQMRQRITACSLPDQEKSDLLADLQNIPTDEYFKAPSKLSGIDAPESLEAV